MPRIVLTSLCLLLACSPLYGQRNERAGQNGLNRPDRGGAGITDRMIDRGGLPADLPNSRVYERDLGQIAPRSAVGQEMSGRANRDMSALAHERKLERRQLREAMRGSAPIVTPETVSTHPGKAYPEHSRRSPEHFTGHDRALQVQLAAVDRMRDRAIEAGDAAMLARADEFEAKIRARFETPVAAPIQAPTDPTVPDPVPAPVDPTEPILPPGDPLIPPTDPILDPVDPVTPPSDPASPPVEPIPDPVGSGQ